VGSSPTKDYGLYGEMVNAPEVVKKAFLTCTEQSLKLFTPRPDERSIQTGNVRLKLE
jgi:hypothetical protein